ncbi:hypothetical protein OEZ86_014320 [Tetradesmus obliquus]|nr:hypothetical protein OEZ86_014320 [Tetradesmus obliquus]
MPTGESYFSLSEYERLTDKRGAKKYLNSVAVLTQPSAVQELQAELLEQQQRGAFRKIYRRIGRLATWLEQQYSCAGYRLAAKGGAYASDEQKWLAAERAAERQTALQLDPTQNKMRDNILAAIQQGFDDLSATHVPLAKLYPAAAAAAAAGQGTRGPAGAAVAAAATAATAAVADAAPAAAAAALAAGHQLYRIEDLQQRAEAAEAATAAAAAAGQVLEDEQVGLLRGYGIPTAGQVLEDEQALAVVPDCNQPFTITMHNPRDGCDYVVAHYEPHALQHATLSSSSSSSSSTGGPAAHLSQIFHSRRGSLLMQRTSAAEGMAAAWQGPSNTVMAMAGSRHTHHGSGLHSHLSRYHDDLG